MLRTHYLYGALFENLFGKILNYLTFRKQFFDLSCVNINQIYAFDQGFDRNNLS